jgi:hypothetical protein
VRVGEDGETGGHTGQRGRAGDVGKGIVTQWVIVFLDGVNSLWCLVSADGR